VRSVRRSRRADRRPLLALLVLVAALAVGYGVRAAHSGGDNTPSGVSAAPSRTTTGGYSVVALSALPPQVDDTVRLIKHGGPFPYPDNDGVTFHNFGDTLPKEPEGFYREYTVPTPGSEDRGARRLVVGADGRYWYTADHYETFALVDLSR
jgi:ribonuclease T1